MASSDGTIEEFSWTCERESDMGSSCTQRAIIDVINLLFFCAFSLFMVIGSITRSHTSVSNRRDWFSIAVSICCALVSIGYFGVGLWDMIGETEKFNHLTWLFYLVRALVWVSLAISLLVRKSKSMRVLAVAWWVSFSVLVSAINIEILAKENSIQVQEMLSWPVNSLLLISAFRVACQQITDESLTEPLLGQKDEKNRSKQGEAGLFSKLMFSRINPLLQLGYLNPLHIEDIPSLDPEDGANVAYQKFVLAWDSLVGENSSGKSRNLALAAVAKVFYKENIFIGVCALLRTIAVVTLPLLLYAFVNYSNVKEQNLCQGLSLLGCQILAKVVESLSQRHRYFYSRRSGMRIRSALMVAVYQKQLMLSSLARRRHSTGEVVNYIAVDAYRMGECIWWFHSIWSLVLQLFLSMAILLWVVGVGALVGLVPLMIFGILNVPIARIIQKYQAQLMVAQDERLRATSEILNSMKTIKLQSWEDKFKNMIESCRDNEFKWLTNMQFMKAYGSVLYWLSPTVVSSVVFLGCALLKSAPLNASTIFTVLATLRGMGEPVCMIPEALIAVIQVKVSFDRINKFLLDDEINNEDRRIIPSLYADESVIIHGGKFSWDPELMLPTLPEVSLHIKQGQKIAVCGPVGAGKSSLLYAILGEIPKISGNVNVFGSITYVSQTSWIQSGTVRDNILFGKPMDLSRYEAAIKACALGKDIDSFPHGDLTEIGERGINMSGGQKQRIQLARAVYNDGDIYLLDDPFSAVDAHTAAILFHDCVMTALGEKTVILVTHQVEFLSAVDRILVMQAGEITQSGNYRELLMAGMAFEELVNAHKDALSGLSPLSNEAKSEPQKGDMVQPEESNMSYPCIENHEGQIPVKDTPGLQITEEEEKESGSVWKPFLDYLLVSGGTSDVCLSTLAQCGFVVLQAVATFWLAFAIQIPEIHTGILVGVYALLSISSAFFIYIRALFSTSLGLKASKTFFSGFTNAIFKAPMQFFDSTPVGRILTRASSDMSILDFDIPFSFTFVMAPLIEIVATIGIMASFTWQVLIVAIFAMGASKYVQGYYLASAKELTRINGTTKAPVMNYAAETSLGVVTIRAFKMANRFFQTYLNLVDKDAVLFFYLNGAQEWLVLRIEALQNATLFTAALLLVLLPKGTVAPGLVGLSLSYALSLTATQVFMTHRYCNLANFVISVERIKQFMQIPPEPPAIVEYNRPPSSWPSNGRIDLQDLKMRYRPGAPLILKGITCTFKEGTRVGVVGRTGSGKTTLISALFHLVEPASGKILIDELDICSIGLKDLRMKLSIIPQEPTLFQGSVRTNLDPLGLHSDQEIWEALEKCQLKATISSLPSLLDSSVSGEGENWSAGQRQLFCLGRVLLRRNRILVLDEATASIDSATDAILQRIIRKEFSNCTVITVAHRVPTVIDSDMVMVLSNGEMLEYDRPSKLMETDSSFAKLVAEYWSSCRKDPY